MPRYLTAKMVLTYQRYIVVAVDYEAAKQYTVTNTNVLHKGIIQNETIVKVERVLSENELRPPNPKYFESDLV